MLAGVTGDATLFPRLEQAWEHMVNRRMYVTGGIGSLPGLEGFGNDYELDPEYAYAETCAALGSLFWNWEMAELTESGKVQRPVRVAALQRRGGGHGTGWNNLPLQQSTHLPGGVNTQTLVCRALLPIQYFAHLGKPLSIFLYA